MARCAAARAAAAPVADDDDDDDDEPEEEPEDEGVLALAGSRAAPARDVSAACPSGESDTRPLLILANIEEEEEAEEEEDEDADAAPKAGERCGEIGAECGGEAEDGDTAVEKIFSKK